MGLYNDFVSEAEFIAMPRRRTRRRKPQVTKQELAKARLAEKSAKWNADRKVRAFVVYRHVLGRDEVRTEVVYLDSFAEAYRWAHYVHREYGRDITFKVGRRTYHIGVKIDPVA